MVRVEPFIYQMVTAFKERIQMVSKINEIIDVVNQDVGIDEVRAVVTEMLSDYYDKEEIDEMFDSIDFSPYYTKTEVNAIVSRIDGDVDAVEGDVDALEGRMTTAEGDIDALETGKQDALTPVVPVTIYNEDDTLKIGIKDLTEVQINDVATYNSVNSTIEFLYDVYVSHNWRGNNGTYSSFVLIKKGTALSQSYPITIPHCDNQSTTMDSVTVFFVNSSSGIETRAGCRSIRFYNSSTESKGLLEFTMSATSIDKSHIHFYRRI